MQVARIVLSLAVLASPLLAQGRLIPRPCPVPMPGVPRGEPLPNVPPPSRCAPIGGAQVVRTSSDVRVELVGRVLRYEIEERFLNRGGLIGEADYLFPLPKGAAFQDLKLSIDGEMVAGETLGAEEARRIYEEIVRRQRDPALVEWIGQGLLRTRIFPIQPGEERRIIVRLQAVAHREGDALRIDWVRGANTPDDASRNARREAGFTLTYDPDDGLGTAFSPTHRLTTRERSGRRVVEARGEGRDVTVLLPLRNASGTAVSTLTHAPGGEDAFALIAVAPPAARGERTPRDVTFVLDVSGSMSGRKMEQAKAAGRQLLATLRSDDRFRLIDFATEVRDFRSDFVHATRENVRDAERYLSSLEANGSTNISGALDEALRGEPARGRLPLVLFLTDGEPTVGERDPEAIAERVARRRGARRLFTFGVGAELNAALVERLAVEGRGTAHFVRPDESVERVVSLVASRLVDPVVTDLRVSAEGDVRLTKLHPGQPLDLFAGQDLVLLTRVRGSGRARLVFEGTSHGRAVRWTHDVRIPERERGNPFVARLWATQRVGWLSAERRRGGGNRELDDEIRTLGERFGIPTEFTSYFVKEPGMVVARDVAAGGRLASPSAMRLDAVVTTGMGAASPAASFEAAKTASAQRSAVSLAEADATLARMGAAERRVGDRVFRLENGRWIDSRDAASRRVVRVKAYSAAWFALADALPELREAFALGERVLVTGRAVIVESGPDGVSEMAPAALRDILQAWR